jgi:hypothetical protein
MRWAYVEAFQSTGLSVAQDCGVEARAVARNFCALGKTCVPRQRRIKVVGSLGHTELDEQKKVVLLFTSVCLSSSYIDTFCFA